MIQLKVDMPPQNIDNLPRLKQELNWTMAPNVIVGKPKAVMLFAEYDATEEVDLDKLIQNCVEMSEKNAFVVLSKLRDFVLQEADPMKVREYARAAEVPLVTWRENITDPETMQGNAIIISFANNKQTNSLPVSNSLFFCYENVLTIFQLAKVKLFYEKSHPQHDKRLDELNKLLTDDFFSALNKANLERIFAQENTEELYGIAQTVSERFDENMGLIPLKISDKHARNWHQDAEHIHDFLIQDIPHDHLIRSHEGYEINRQLLYSLVSAYIRCPGVPPELIESVIEHRILPDLQKGNDQIKNEFIRSISDLGHRNHQQFFHVLAGSKHSQILSYSIAASAGDFSTPQDAAEVMAELFTFAKEIDEHLFTTMWEVFRRDINDSLAYDEKMIRSIGDAMVNRFGRLFTLDEQMMLMDSMIGELNDAVMKGQSNPRFVERVGAITSRISYYAFRQISERKMTIHPDVMRSWFQWVENQQENTYYPSTFLYVFGMPDTIVSSDQKNHMLQKFSTFTLSHTEVFSPSETGEDRPLRVMINRDDVNAVRMILKNPAVSDDIKQKIRETIIAPLRSDLELLETKKYPDFAASRSYIERGKEFLDPLLSL